MKKGRGDRVVDILNERFDRTRAKLRKDFKGEKPFRMEPVDNDTLMYVYDNMSSASLGDLPDPNDPSYIGDMEYALETYGEEDVNQWLFEMDQLKQRRGL